MSAVPCEDKAPGSGIEGSVQVVGGSIGGAAATPGLESGITPKLDTPVGGRPSVPDDSGGWLRSTSLVSPHIKRSSISSAGAGCGPPLPLTNAS